MSGNLGITGSGLGNRLYAMYDANFDITGMVDTSGNVQQRYVYDPYGTKTLLDASYNVLGTDTIHLAVGYQGGWTDPVSGLVQFGARAYDPATGTWMQQDPAGYVDGMSLYQFSDSNPVSESDPAGTDPYVELVPGHGSYHRSHHLGHARPFSSALFYSWVGVPMDSSLDLSNYTSGTWGWGGHGTVDLERMVRLYPLQVTKDGCKRWMIMADADGQPVGVRNEISAALGVERERTGDDTMTIRATFASALSSEGSITVKGDLGPVGLEVQFPTGTKLQDEDEQSWTYQLKGE